MNVKKYRPYFTLDELKVIHGTLHEKNQVATLTRYVGRYIEDIEDGYRKESILTSASIEQKLGLVDPPTKPRNDKEQQRRYENNEMSPEEERDWMIKNGLDPDTGMPIGM